MRIAICILQCGDFYHLTFSGGSARFPQSLRSPSAGHTSSSEQHQGLTVTGNFTTLCIGTCCHNCLFWSLCILNNIKALLSQVTLCLGPYCHNCLFWSLCVLNNKALQSQVTLQLFDMGCTVIAVSFGHCF